MSHGLSVTTSTNHTNVYSIVHSKLFTMLMVEIIGTDTDTEHSSQRKVKGRNRHQRNLFGLSSSSNPPGPHQLVS